MIALIDEWEDPDGTVQKRNAQSDLGGTMRLGAQSSDVKPGTLAHEIYGNVLTERHRHRYEANENYLDRLTDAGLVISAITQREKLTEIVELPTSVHPWFIGVQFHPSSSRRRGAAIRSSSRSSTPRSSTRRRAAPKRWPLRVAPPGGGPALRPTDEALRYSTPGSSTRCSSSPARASSSPSSCRWTSPGTLKEITGALGVPFIFKSSYDKANRSSGTSFRGPGIDKGLEILAKVKRELGVPILTDVHREDEIGAAASVVDVLQTPAFLCRQTDFIRAVAQSGKPVNIKKGQFLAPHDMKNVLDKARAAAREAGLSEDRFMACERGASFGYNNLVSDMRSLAIMRETNAPVVFDATHSVQLPGGQGTSSGGQREFVPVLARAAVAVGVAGIFMETHPDPAKALSDGPNAVPLKHMRALLEQLAELDRAVKSRPLLEQSFDA